MRKLFAALLGGLCMLLFTASMHSEASTPPNIDEGVKTKIDLYVQSQMKEYRIPGLALAIVRGDKIEYMRGYGSANPTGEPVTPQTSFITGSIGKAITASALMMLVDSGKIDLDAPVQQYLPWFTVADGEASGKITVRMVLNHTSGIPVNAGLATQAYSDLSPDALENQVRSIKNVQLNHAPGTAYEYANMNYQIAGMIVQAVSGEPFQSFIQDHIYAPLNMNDCYNSREKASSNGMATGYRYWFGYPIAVKSLPYSYAQFPAGWYICSVEDLAQFLIMHMNNGVYDGKVLISPEGMTELHRPELNGYAMGWVVESDLISHNGGVPDFGSGIYYNPNTKTGVVVEFNVNTGYFFSPAYVIAPSILRIINGNPVIQPVIDQQYRTMVIGLGVTLVIQVLWLILSARLLRQWYASGESHPESLIGKIAWLGVPLLFELGLIYFILNSLLANGGNIIVDYIYLPDVTLLAAISFLLAVGWGAIRTLLSIRLLRKPAAQIPAGADATI